MQLSPEELQYLLNAIDTHVRANGLNVAAAAALLAQKIQEETKKMNKPQDND